MPHSPAPFARAPLRARGVYSYCTTPKRRLQPFPADRPAARGKRAKNPSPPRSKRGIKAPRGGGSKRRAPRTGNFCGKQTKNGREHGIVLPAVALLFDRRCIQASGGIEKRGKTRAPVRLPAAPPRRANCCPPALRGTAPATRARREEPPSHEGRPARCRRLRQRRPCRDQKLCRPSAAKIAAIYVGRAAELSMCPPLCRRALAPHCKRRTSRAAQREREYTGAPNGARPAPMWLRLARRAGREAKVRRGTSRPQRGGPCGRIRINFVRYSVVWTVFERSVQSCVLLQEPVACLR